MQECPLCGNEKKETDGYRCSKCEEEFKKSQIYGFVSGISLVALIFFVPWIFYSHNIDAATFIASLFLFGIHTNYKEKLVEIEKDKSKRKLRNYFEKIETKYLTSLTDEALRQYNMDNYEFVKSYFKEYSSLFFPHLNK